MPDLARQRAARAAALQRLRSWTTHSQLRRLAALSLSIGTAQVLLALGGVVTAHALGPDGKGVVAAVTTWAQMLGWLLLVNLDTASSVRVAGSGEPASPSAVGNAILYAVVVGGPPACASGLILSMLLAHLGTDARMAAAIGMATIPIDMLVSVLQSVNMALGNTRRFNVARMTGPSVLLPAIVLMWALSGLTPFRVILATLGGSLATLIVASARLPWRRLTVDLRTLRSDLHFGLRLLPSGLLGLANGRLDVLVMSVAISATQIGLYSVANNAYMPAGLLGSAIAILITPAVASITQTTAGTPYRAAQQQITKIVRYARMNLFITGVIGLALAALAPVLLPIVFGPAFGSAVLLLWVLIPGNLARSYATTVAAGASGMRRAWVGNTAEIAGFAATVLLLPVLLWRYGVLGAAVASTCSYVASAVAARLSLAILRRRIELDSAVSVDSPEAAGKTRTA